MKNLTSLCAVVSLCVYSTLSVAEETHEKYVSHTDMVEQGFKENPPMCYPQGSAAWKEVSVPVADKKVRWFETQASCRSMSNVLGKNYSVMSGGVDHTRDKARVFDGPEWYLVQSHPTVPEPGVRETDSWKCAIAIVEEELTGLKTPYTEFHCYVNCCQLQAANAPVPRPPQPPQRLTADMPRILGVNQRAYLFDWGVGVVRIPNTAVAPLHQAGEAACSNLGAYKPIAYYAPAYGNYTVNGSGYLSPFPQGGNGPNVGNTGNDDPNRYTTKVLCDYQP